MRAARAAGDVALRHRGGPLAIEVKSAEVTDVVTVADREAEAAALAVLEAERPDDAVLGEEGTDRPGTGGRRWVIDAIDGTLNYTLGIPAWCAAVVLVDAKGPLVSAVFDAERGELFTAERGQGARLDGEPLAVRPGVPLAAAAVSCQWGFGKLAHEGVRDAVRRVLDSVGAVRIPGSGTLELAWVASGRLHGWMQPEAAEWDWLPGALLVSESGGVATTVSSGPTRWSLAGDAALVAQLLDLIRPHAAPPR